MNVTKGFGIFPRLLSDKVNNILPQQEEMKKKNKKKTEPYVNTNKSFCTSFQCQITFWQFSTP